MIMKEEIISMVNEPDLETHFDWQLKEIGIVSTRETVKEAWDYCNMIAEGSDSPAHVITACGVLWNTITIHYNKKIDEMMKEKR